MTTHGRMRRLPDQGADHGTVDHCFPSDGVFLLLHERVLPSRWLISLRRSSSSLSSLWMAFWCERIPLRCWRCLRAFRVEDPSSARKTGPNRCQNWARPAGLGPLRPGSVAPFAPWVLMHLCTLPPPLAWFWWCYPHIQDGGSLSMKFDLLRFNPQGCSS
jgi:hypothetical protein